MPDIRNRGTSNFKGARRPRPQVRAPRGGAHPLLRDVQGSVMGAVVHENQAEFVAKSVLPDVVLSANR
jgi:hypothetical protein